MPVGGRRAAVAAAFCLTLGSTALLTWAFSVFSEDKKKGAGRPLAPPAQALLTKLPDGESRATDSVNRSTSSVAENNSREPTSDPKVQGSLVIENKSAVEPLNSTDDVGYRYPTYEKFNKPQEVEGDAEMVTAEASVDFFQRVPRFDSRYNSSFTKSSIADTVVTEQITAIVGDTQTSLLRQVSLDTKVTTYEEELPATQQIVSDEFNHSAHGIPSSVSCKSLETAIMYAPLPKSTTVSVSGVDNSIDEMDLDVDDVIEMSSLEPLEFSFDESIKLSSSESSRTYSKPPEQRQNHGVDNSTDTLESNAIFDIANEKDEQFQKISALSSVKQNGVLGVDNSVFCVSKETSEVGMLDEISTDADALLSKTCPGEVLVDSSGMREAADPISPLTEHIKDIPQSEGSTEAKDSNFHNEAPDFNDNFGTDFTSSSPTSSFTALDKSETADTGDETQSAHVFAVINNDSVNQVSDYYSARRLEREISPNSFVLDLSPDSLNKGKKTPERSEMTFQVGVDKRSSSSSCDSGSTTPQRRVQKTDLYINISSDSPHVERSEFYSPPKMERELTPTSPLSSFNSAKCQPNSDTLQRSELRLHIKGQKVPKLDDCDSLNDVDSSLVLTQDIKPDVDSLESEISIEVHQELNTYVPADEIPADETVDGLTSNASNEKLNHRSVGSLPEITISDAGSACEELEFSLQSDIITDEVSSVSSGSVEYSRTQMTETEEMIETSVEETVTMVITGVVTNPGSKDESLLSMQDAVSKGLLDLENGLYYNSTVGDNMSLIDAMNSGYIKMGPKKIEKSEEKVKSVGIITIKTTRETMPYTVKGAKDMRDGVMYHAFQATRRKILDSDKGTFTDLHTGSRMLIGDAVDLGLVNIEYDMTASGLVQEEITKTYSVHAVVDKKEKSKLAFHDAVSRGLIDADTGEYIDNTTGTHVPVEEAISKGYIKATLTDSPDKVTVDDMGSKAAEKGVDVIRRKVLTPLKVVKGMKS